MRRYLTLSLLLSVMALNACGTRGSLYLPSPPPPPAVQSEAGAIAPSES